MGHSDGLLIEEIAKLQAEVDSAHDEMRLVVQRLEQSRKLEQRLARYVEATFWLLGQPVKGKAGWFGQLCKAATEHLHWDSAYVVEWPKGVVVTMAGATLKQGESAATVLSSENVLKARARHRSLFSSFSGTEKEGLLLRAAFQAEEVVAVPIHIGDDKHHYLVVASHDVRPDHGAAEEQYLGKFAATVGNYLSGK